MTVPYEKIVQQISEKQSQSADESVNNLKYDSHQLQISSIEAIQPINNAVSLKNTDNPSSKEPVFLINKPDEGNSPVLSGTGYLLKKRESLRIPLPDIDNLKKKLPEWEKQISEALSQRGHESLVKSLKDNFNQFQNLSTESKFNFFGNVSNEQTLELKNVNPSRDTESNKLSCYEGQGTDFIKKEELPLITPLENVSNEFQINIKPTHEEGQSVNNFFKSANTNNRSRSSNEREPLINNSNEDDSPVLCTCTIL